MKAKLAIIGAGFTGLSAAAATAAAGYEVDVYEKFSIPGGRARQFSQQGFHFNMGPSWYWMPDIIDSEFKRYGYTTDDFFDLQRLDPSYTVFWSDDPPLQVPTNPAQLIPWMEQREKGAGKKLKQFLDQARRKYHLGMWDLAQKHRPGVRDLLRPAILKSIFSLDLFKSLQRHINQYFTDPQIRQLLSFPVLFLGGTARQMPALYSLMNYADLVLGSWYPRGGMYELVKAWYRIAEECGAEFHFNTEIEGIDLAGGTVCGLHGSHRSFKADALIATSDYHHMEQELLPDSYRIYSSRYWKSRTMAPSCLIYYLGLDCKLDSLTHHNLFFDEDLERHAHSLYENPDWPERPLFYACCPSKTDPSAAPEGMENLFLLIPVAPGLEDTEAIQDRYFDILEKRLAKHIGIHLSDHLVVKEVYGVSDFASDYNAFRGNAYGMANTLRQTSILKPAMQHPKIANMVFGGQLTQPGPGIPPCLISGRMAAQQITRGLAS
jgi:phytoene desaturase